MLKARLNILLLIIILLMNNSCNTTKTNRSFTIGKGGGFTGRYDTYRVCENGLVYLVREDMSEELLMKTEKNEISGIFCQFEKLNITGTTFSHPGNITSFIRYTVDGKTYEIKWGSPGVKPPQHYVDFFDKVWSLIRKKQ